MKAPVKVLAVDIGGTNVKILPTGQKDRWKFPSGKSLTPRRMVTRVKQLAKDWQYAVVSIGYPGVLRDGRPVAEPKNLAKGWVRFDFQAAFGCPVKMINQTFEEDLGVRGLKKLGRKKWQKRVEVVTQRFVSALNLDDVVLGGGNAKKLTRLPVGCRMGDNALAFVGGFRLWETKAEQ